VGFGLLQRIRHFDVVVPHTRTVPDMLSLLNVIVIDDPIAQGSIRR
jgi:amidase